MDVELPPLLVTRYTDSQSAQTSPSSQPSTHTPTSTPSPSDHKRRHQQHQDPWDVVRVFDMSLSALPSFDNPNYLGDVRSASSVHSNSLDHNDESAAHDEASHRSNAVNNPDIRNVGREAVNAVDRTPRVLPSETEVEVDAAPPTPDSDPSPPQLQLVSDESEDADAAMGPKKRARTHSYGKWLSSNLRAGSASSRPSSEHPKPTSATSDAIVPMLQLILDKQQSLDTKLDSLQSLDAKLDALGTLVEELSQRVQNVESVPSAITERIDTVQATYSNFQSLVNAVGNGVADMRATVYAKLDGITEALEKQVSMADRVDKLERHHAQRTVLPHAPTLVSSTLREITAPPPIPAVPEHPAWDDDAPDSPAIEIAVPSPVLTAEVPLSQLAAEAEPSQPSKPSKASTWSSHSRRSDANKGLPSSQELINVFTVEERQIMATYQSSQPDEAEDKGRGSKFEHVAVWDDPLDAPLSSNPETDSAQRHPSRRIEILSADPETNPASPSAQDDHHMDADVIDVTASDSQANDDEVDELIDVKSEASTPEMAPQPLPVPTSKSKPPRFQPPASVGSSKRPPAPFTSPMKNKACAAAPTAAPTRTTAGDTREEPAVFFRGGSVQPDPRKRKLTEDSRALSVGSKTPEASSSKKPKGDKSTTMRMPSKSSSKTPKKSPKIKASPASSSKSRSTTESSIHDSVVKLKSSDGVKRGTGKWPSFPEGWNNFDMITDEIECEKCGGRVHWGCAGVGAVGTVVDSPWYCPDCVEHIKNDTTDIILPPPRDRCIRPNCLRRRKMRTVRKDGDEERYHVKKIIGRRAIGRRPDDSRVFHFLVLWDGWPVRDSTWEPEDHLSHDAAGNCAVIKTFLDEATEQGVNLKKKVALLHEAHVCWDPVTGDLVQK